MSSKIIPAILLVVILGVGFIAYTFYTDKQSLMAENGQLKEVKASLIEENSQLKSRYGKLQKEAGSLKSKLSAMQRDLSRIENERKNWEKKYEDASRERDMLAEKIKSSSSPVVARDTKALGVGGVDTSLGSDQHWADFVKKKASLEANLERLNRQLLGAKGKIAELDKNNKELSIKIDQLTKDRMQLREEIKVKERTLRIMSMDLVSEREERGGAVKELQKLRRENVGLKRELVLSSKEKINLQKNLRDSMDKKSALEDKIADAENILKERSLAFEELQNQLGKAISGGKRIVAGESASVELPPIVVKPSALGLQGLRGEIIAVNTEEKFVIIDVGENSGLRAGVLLRAMRGDREIATVEVIETRKDIAAADIKEVVSGFFIQEGDIVINR